MKVRFSIITICFNDKMRLAKTLKSVYEQEYSDYEHIVIDGNSSDGTFEYIEESRKHYNRGKLIWFSEADKGIYDAMNKGVQRANGDLLCFLNCGDVFFDSKVLQNISEIIDKEPGKDIYFGNAICVYPDGTYKTNFVYDVEKTFEENSSKGQLMPCHQAIFASQNCFKDNLFDVTYSLRAELNWFLRCVCSGKTMKGVPYVLCKYEYGGMSDRLKSIKKSECEMKTILQSMNLVGVIDAIESRKSSTSDSAMICIMDKWLALLHAGKGFEYYLNLKNKKNVAIYGYGLLGTHLVSELRESSITVNYIVDREKKDSFCSIPIYKPTDTLPDADIMIITLVNEYEEVYQDMRKKWTGCIMVIDDILEEMWAI